MAQVPEGRRVFSGLTVQQNLQMGAYTRRDGKEAIQNDFDMVFDLLPALEGAPTTSPPVRFPAASSRCWPWAAP